VVGGGGKVVLCLGAMEMREKKWGVYMAGGANEGEKGEKVT
jgi:hypothetical protein